MSSQKFGPIGIGRGMRRPPYISDSFQPPLSSSPKERGTRTPPPSGATPFLPRTPEGVLTQVQRRKTESSPTPSVDSNNTDDLFNDSFEFEDIEIPQTNLTQEFPKCRVQDSIINEKDVGADTLEKVLIMSDIGISSDKRVLDYQDGMEIKQRISLLNAQSKGDLYPCMIRRADPESAEFDAVRPNWVHPMLRSPKLRINRTDESGASNLIGDDTSGEKRSASDTETWEERKKSSRDESDGQRLSDDLLTEEQIMKMLGSLTPEPKSSNQPTSDTGARTKVSASNPRSGNADAKNWGVQVPLDMGDGEPISTMETNNGIINIRLRTTPADYGSQISTAVRQVRHALVKLVDGVVQETGLEKHDFPRVSRNEVITTEEVFDVGSNGSARKTTITIPEVVTNAKEQIQVTFETSMTAKFLLVARNVLTACWTIPSRQRFHDVINQTESRIRREGLDCLSVLEWNSEWQGGIGLLGLKVSDLDALQSFRSVISGIQVGDMVYNTYPKDLLDYGNEVSIYMKPELRCFDLEFLPNSLFEKNRLLAGNVIVRYSKFIQSSGGQPIDFNLCGKVVIMEGDDEFLRSLQKYPTNYSFRVGSFTVKIRQEGEGPDIINIDDDDPQQHQRQQQQATSNESTLQHRQHQQQQQQQPQQQQGHQQHGNGQEQTRSTEISTGTPMIVDSFFPPPPPVRVSRWGRTLFRADGHGLPLPVPSVASSLDGQSSDGASEWSTYRGRGRGVIMRGRTIKFEQY